MTEEELNRGALYVNRGIADGDVEFFARVGLVSQVVPDGRYWRVNVFPLQIAAPVAEPITPDQPRLAGPKRLYRPAIEKSGARSEKTA